MRIIQIIPSSAIFLNGDFEVTHYYILVENLEVLMNNDKSRISPIAKRKRER